MCEKSTGVREGLVVWSTSIYLWEEYKDNLPGMVMIILGKETNKGFWIPDNLVLFKEIIWKVVIKVLKCLYVVQAKQMHQQEKRIVSR